MPKLEPNLSVPRPVISASGLAARLGGRTIFSAVDLEILPGDFVGLLGPNGAGKTTLLRALQALVPSTGRIDVAGTIGYVPQRHDVEWDFPIDVRGAVLNGRTGLIGWFRRPRQRDRDAAGRAIELVKLEDLAARPIAELSGGQRQRVLIARALATEPQVLLLDEPFTGLDAPSTETLLALFAELSAAGTAIVMSTHNLAEAAHTCQRLVLFNAGIVADAPAEHLLTQTAPWTRAFGVSANSPLLSAIGVGAPAHKENV